MFSKSIGERFWNQTDETPEEEEALRHELKPDVREDWNLIKQIQSQTNLYRLIVSSFCPQIYGHELVKSALVLSVFAGVDKHDKECKDIRTRGQIHVLVFGDHGSNKDMLLKSVLSMASKAEYVCGNTSTLDMLTTTLKKRNKRQYLEKGSLVSEQFAICCIDDFERLNAIQLQAIQEVMDYQTVSVHKNGMFCQIPAKTSIIATVNPLNGCYYWSENVWQNTRLNGSLLSKFDLIFALVDSPDEELDSNLSKDVLDSRKENWDSSQKRVHKCLQTSDSNRIDSNLMSKLIYGPEEQPPDLIAHELLKRYVTYAQQFIDPVISAEARDLLIGFSEEMARTEICKSITANVETLYRLTEARARLDLRLEATGEDANDVIDIVRHSIGKHYVLPNMTNKMQFINSFKNSSKKQFARNLHKVLQTIAEQNQQNLFSVDQIVEICTNFSLPFDTKDDILRAIDRLNNESILLKTGSNYKLIP